ncbi:tripartite tricarboxylate transporter substrate binding protein [Edaphobacillus lindanitolerans]|uniref:Tripartite-type tricarboxylate transporter, receptor component TctC n=1 Tax=Edaphobacillus lindanitolerans TaxID=550447 RepID=A0A1U7PN11_9BACI|nr:tripartite tricarboxylate transporter substrate binding protein [Edaphobacillus lindanitolerans]SIT71410.1 Tripartite-type tricarboxylate transporter, receptor component TctC [Edaphobacillus lindanitolerans]
MKKKIILSALLLFSAVLGACSDSGSSAEAEDAAAGYPEKPIQLIVPWSAGGDTDAIYRIASAELSKELGQKVVIQNVAGASGVVGAQQALTAKPDGYTLLAVHDSVAMSQMTGQAEFGYSDFEPVAMLTSSYDFVATSPDNPWDSMADLVADAEKNPGKISYAASIGSTSQLEPVLLESVADIKLNIVGYDGTAERMKAVVANDVALGSVSAIAGKDYIADNRMKLIGYNGAERSNVLPDVPTLKEQGLDMVSGTNRGIVAPKGTPEAIIERLSDALEKVASNEDFVKKIVDMGTDVNFKNTEDYKEFIKQSEEEMKELLKTSGLLKE